MNNLLLSRPLSRQLRYIIIAKIDVVRSASTDKLNLYLIGNTLTLGLLLLPSLTVSRWIIRLNYIDERTRPNKGLILFSDTLAYSLLLPYLKPSSRPSKEIISKSDYRIIRSLKKNSKLSPQAIQPKTAAYKRSCYLSLIHI